jgi:hypothetical protein
MSPPAPTSDPGIGRDPATNRTASTRLDRPPSRAAAR